MLTEPVVDAADKFMFPAELRILLTPEKVDVPVEVARDRLVAVLSV
jgi:hypothetical protein